MTDIINVDGQPTGGIFVDTLISGSRWAQEPGAPAIIHYMFKSEGDIFQNVKEVVPWTEAEKAALRKAQSVLESVANVKFVEAEFETDAEVWYWKDAEMGGANGWHNMPITGGSTPLYGVFNCREDYWKDATDPGGAAFWTFLHEIGHGLGLAHPHDGTPDPDATIFPGVTDMFSAGDGDKNIGLYSMMSYLVNPGEEPGIGFASTPMAFDIAALQEMYGANMSTATGDDTYVVPSINEPGTSWSCIWDAGGTDTISAGGADLSCTIDLRDALLDGPEAGGYASRMPDIYGGMTIAHGVTIENGIGGGGDDMLIGNEVDNELIGLAGADRIFGRAGSDSISGASGDDFLVGDAGHDNVTGGGGDDQLEGQTGNDTLTGGAGADALFGNEGRDTLEGGDGDDSIEAAEDDDTATGGDGADYIDGGEGADVLDGGDGDDEVYGGAGNDTINTGDGFDWANGEAGNDTLNGGDGNDTLRGEDGNDVLLGGAGSDELTGQGGTDILMGGADDDTLSGGEGLDLLSGGMGDDVLSGGAGNDLLTGSLGNDALTGGDGNDTLTGGFGNDKLSAGAGSDRFTFVEFAGRANADVIIDFNAASDKIVINNAYFSKLADGALEAKNFFIGAEAHDAKDFIVFNQATGELWYDADGRANLPAQLICTINVGGLTGTLTAGNFEII